MIGWDLITPRDLTESYSINSVWLESPPYMRLVRGSSPRWSTKNVYNPWTLRMAASPRSRIHLLKIFWIILSGIDIRLFGDCINCLSASVEKVPDGVKTPFEIRRKWLIMSHQKSCENCRKHKNCHRKTVVDVCDLHSLNDGVRACFICGSTYQIEEHHIFGASNRKRSTYEGLTIDLCANCHRLSNTSVHLNNETNLKLKKIGQKQYENAYGKGVFIKSFGRNYL